MAVSEHDYLERLAEEKIRRMSTTIGSSVRHRANVIHAHRDPGAHGTYAIYAHHAGNRYGAHGLLGRKASIQLLLIAP